MKTTSLKYYVLGLGILGAMVVRHDAVSQIIAAPCIGAAPTVTRPAPDTLDIVGTACMDTVNLDVILAATPAPAIGNVKVKLQGQRDTFTSSGHPGIKLAVYGGNGNDSITVGGSGANAFAQADLYGDAGNDTIVIAENPGQAVGGSGADILDSGDTTTVGPIPQHNLITGTLAAPGDGSADTINCFDGPPGGAFFIQDFAGDFDIRVGC